MVRIADVSCSVYCILYIVYCILYIVYCILHIAYCILYIVYCILYIAYCILHIVYCILYIVYWSFAGRCYKVHAKSPPPPPLQRSVWTGLLPFSDSTSSNNAPIPRLKVCVICVTSCSVVLMASVSSKIPCSPYVFAVLKTARCCTCCQPCCCLSGTGLLASCRCIDRHQLRCTAAFFCDMSLLVFIVWSKQRTCGLQLLKILFVASLLAWYRFKPVRAVSILMQ